MTRKRFFQRKTHLLYWALPREVRLDLISQQHPTRTSTSPCRLHPDSHLIALRPQCGPPTDGAYQFCSSEYTTSSLHPPPREFTEIKARAKGYQRHIASSRPNLISCPRAKILPWNSSESAPADLIEFPARSRMLSIPSEHST